MTGPASELESAPVAAIVVAAGSGRRFGQDKTLLRLGGRPVLDWSLRALEAAPSVAYVVLLLNETNLDPARRLVRRNGYRKVRFTGLGGPRRQDSVWNGLRLATGAGWALIHDAARPFVTVELIERCVAGARETSGAIAAVPVTDTIKIVREDLLVQENLNRARLWAAQTPQVFRYDWLVAAYRDLGAREVTDDGELYLAAGHPVGIVPGSEENLKITNPSDLLLARAIARQRSAGHPPEETA